MNRNDTALQPVPLALSLGTFLLIAYFACLVLALVVTDRGLHQPWLQFFPGFAWTPLGILIGAAESFAYGFVSGLVFAPIANFFGVFRSA
ncbi:MAG: hypothetical protein FJX62_04685 [Alphaproteobacteria bacterium]|nr:hypothetical protein [Alphaproteobacteria bacterium]